MTAPRLRWALPLLLAVPCVATAQSLVFTSPAQTLAAGRPSAGFVVERRGADGAPLAAGQPALTVTFSSSATTGELSSSILRLYPSARVTVTIPANASTSPRVFYWDAAPGAPTLTASAPGFQPAAQVVTIDSFGFSDDVETGSVADTEAVPGHWEFAWVRAAGNSVTATPLAAHHGRYGLRMVDANGVAGAGSEVSTQTFVAPTTGAFYVRTWFRLAQHNNRGSTVVFQIAGQQAGQALFDVWMIFPGALGAAGGYDVTNGYLSAPTFTTSLGDGQWHLIEAALTGVGSGAGGRQLWVDGVRVHTQAGLNFTGLSVGHLSLGEVYSNDRTFTGTLDFDDVRTGPLPPASRLDVRTETASAEALRCTPLTVMLSSADGSAAAAAQDLSIAVASAALSGGLFLDSACTQTADGVPVKRGARAGTAYFVPSNAGATTLAVAHPDYLSGTPFALSVTPFSGAPVDGGVASLPRAQAEAPAETLESRRLAVGCSAADGVLPSLALLVLLVLRGGAVSRRRAQ